MRFSKSPASGWFPVLIKAQEKGLRALTDEERQNYDRTKMRFMELCGEAAKAGIHILVDAEHYAYRALVSTSGRTKP